MRIAFIFIAEAYQAYHLAAVALKLRRMEGVSIDVFYNDPETPRHLNRIAAAHGETPLDARPLSLDWRAQLIRIPRIFGLAKQQVLSANRVTLQQYDMLVFPERVGSILKAGGWNKQTALAYIAHGPAGRKVAAERLARDFDLILLPGEEDMARYLKAGCLHEGGYRITGYPKLETVGVLHQVYPPLFTNDRPVILYNPHKVRRQSSWSRCIEPMLTMMSHQHDFNLVIAPHIKMFHRKSQRVRDAWAARSTNHILIDPGSDRCLDNSYTAIADIYVGDVSSQ
ncbi:MAG: hypothetical protein ABI395_05995, partial [Sphingobium sp.]